MREEIKPRYEIIFNDLRNHLIGDFLGSRDFKLVMSKNGYYEGWQNVREKVKVNRSYFSTNFDHNYQDNIDTLSVFLNGSCENDKIEKVITLIIVSFIEYKKNNEDFSDVIEAMKVAQFSNKSIDEVDGVFKKHKELKLPERTILQSTNIKKNQTSKTNKNDVFIVHGHNEELKEKVSRTIEKLKLNPVILHEQSNKGQTIIEKFEKHSNVNFAVVLLTYDDLGNNKSDKNPNKRARQNVILEMGYFIAKIGRENVMPLYEKDVELPSDISGILYTLIDENDNWKFKLVKELKEAGFKVDANDII